MHSPIGHWLLTLLVACAALPAYAQEPPAPPAAPASGDVTPEAPAAETTPPEVAEVVESARRTARSTAEWLARGVDSWFGDIPFSEGGRVSDGRMSVSLLVRQHQKPDYSLRFNARFKLPNVQRASYLFVGRDDQRELVTDKPYAFSREQRLLGENPADRSFFAGLGLRVRESIEFRVGFRGGLKPYAQARYRQPWQISPVDLAEFRETLFWTLDDHFGSTTAASYEHAFSSTLAGRWLGAATITQRVKKVEWSTIVGSYKLFGDQRLLSLEALATGVEGSGVAVSDYGVQTKWEQPIYKDWLLSEVLLGHFWPRLDAQSPRLRAWAIGVALKMKF
ncbi:MAG TPA: hypothetical protein VJ608_00735 [Albitalea sp.]|nr:hypothetical protein [Albitalea sp.]HJW12727.1 hypothetical protein [Albitalea sp.]